MADAKAIDAAIAAAVQAPGTAARGSGPISARRCWNIASRASANVSTSLRWRCASRPANRSRMPRAKSTRLIDTFKVAAEESVRIDGEVHQSRNLAAREGLSRLHASACRSVRARSSRRSIFRSIWPHTRSRRRLRWAARSCSSLRAARRSARSSSASAGGNRLAERRVLDSSRASRRRGPVHHRRAVQTAVLHRFAGRGLGSEGARRQEKGHSRTRRQCRGDRRLGPGRSAGLRGRAHVLRRVLSIRAELHRRAAHPGAGGFLRPLSRCVRERRHASSLPATRRTKRPSSAR